jgi:FtsH-binding integral membrane protein
MAPTCDAFFGKIFAHLAGAMAVSAASAQYIDMGDIFNFKNIWISLIINIIILILLLYLVFITPVGSIMKYGAFALFALWIGQILKPVVDKLEDKNLLIRVFSLTSIVFFTMMALGFYDKQSLLGFGPYLFAALIGLIIGEILLYIFGENKKFVFRVFDIFAVGLFVIFTAYDMQLLKEYKKSCISMRGGPDYPVHSLGLYLDFMNLFSNIGDLMSD